MIFASQGPVLPVSTLQYHLGLHQSISHCHCSIVIISLLGALYLLAMDTLKGRINFWSWLPSHAIQHKESSQPPHRHRLNPPCPCSVMGAPKVMVWLSPPDSSKITPPSPVWKASVVSVQQHLTLWPERRSESKQKILQQRTQWSEVVGRPCALPGMGKWEHRAGGGWQWADRCSYHLANVCGHQKREGAVGREWEPAPLPSQSKHLPCHASN